MSTKPPSSDRNAPEDFWDLGDDDLDLVVPAIVEAEAEEEIILDLSEEQGHEPEEEIVTAEEPPMLQMEEQAVQENSSEHRGGIMKSLGALTIIEKLSLLALLSCLAGAAIWGVATYLREAPQGKLITFNEDFPIKGKNISVAEVETWWRNPIRGGDNADHGVVIEANLIPCARIKLENSGNTTLQLTFRNGDFDLVGDPITLLVENGKFTNTGSDELVINSTSGFTNPSQLNAYVNGDIDPWSLVIEDESESSDTEKPLLRVRIDAIYKED